MMRLRTLALMAMLLQPPGARAATVFFDAFDRPDGGLGSNWESTPFGALPSIQSQQACIGPAAEGVALYAGTFDPKVEGISVTSQVIGSTVDSVRTSVILANLSGPAPTYVAGQLRESGEVKVTMGTGDGSPETTLCTSTLSEALQARSLYTITFGLSLRGVATISAYNASKVLIGTTSCLAAPPTFNRVVTVVGRDTGTGLTCIDNFSIDGTLAPTPTPTAGGTKPPPKDTPTSPPKDSPTPTPTFPPKDTPTSPPKDTPTNTPVPTDTPTPVPTDTPTSIPSTPTATATATVPAMSMELESVVLSRGRDRSPNDNGRVSLRARIDDSASGIGLSARLASGGFYLDVSDGDGSFHVNFPVGACEIRTNGDALCETGGAIRSQIRLIGTEQVGQWLLRVRAFGFPNSETGPTGTVNSTEDPVTVTLSNGGEEVTATKSGCRAVGATKLSCR